MLGAKGLLRLSSQPWRAYFRPDFHPSQQHSNLSAEWLAQNTALFTRVGTA